MLNFTCSQKFNASLPRYISSLNYPGQTPKYNRSFSLNPTAKQVTFSDPVTLQLARVQGPGPDLLGIMESLQLGT